MYDSKKYLLGSYDNNGQLDLYYDVTSTTSATLFPDSILQEIDNIKKAMEEDALLGKSADIEILKSKVKNIEDKFNSLESKIDILTQILRDKI